MKGCLRKIKRCFVRMKQRFVLTNGSMSEGKSLIVVAKP
jgi:hypothetical protein